MSHLHENLCSVLHHQIHNLSFKPTSLVFDFASFGFDVAIHNIFATLVIGGCVCIPSDADQRITSKIPSPSYKLRSSI